MNNLLAAWNYIKLWWETERLAAELFQSNVQTINEMVDEEPLDEYDEVVGYAGGCPNYNRQDA